MTYGSAFSYETSAASVVSLRLSVGYLGERDASGWWRSGFMSPTALAFLGPIYGAKVVHAQYQGLVESAMRIHDERIGVGRVFHPFRLPEAHEQSALGALQAISEHPIECISSSDAAMKNLRKFAVKSIDVKPGPTLVGPLEMLGDTNWITKVASIYMAAFVADIQCFPYFSDSP